LWIEGKKVVAIYLDKLLTLSQYCQEISF